MSFLRIPQLPDDLLVARQRLVQRTGEAAVLLGGSKYDLALPKLKDLVRDFPQEPFLHYVYGSALSSLSMSRWRASRNKQTNTSYGRVPISRRT